MSLEIIVKDLEMTIVLDGVALKTQDGDDFTLTMREAVSFMRELAAAQEEWWEIVNDTEVGDDDDEDPELSDNEV